MLRLIFVRSLLVHNKDLQHPRANTPHKPHHATHESKTNALSFMQKGTQRNQTCSKNTSHQTRPEIDAGGDSLLFFNVEYKFYLIWLSVRLPVHMSRNPTDRELTHVFLAICHPKILIFGASYEGRRVVRPAPAFRPRSSGEKHLADGLWADVNRRVVTAVVIYRR
jgi:hypothetical protein